MTCRFECERSMFVVLAEGSKPTRRGGTGRLEEAILCCVGFVRLIWLGSWVSMGCRICEGEKNASCT